MVPQLQQFVQRTVQTVRSASPQRSAADVARVSHPRAFSSRVQALGLSARVIRRIVHKRWEEKKYINNR